MAGYDVQASHDYSVVYDTARQHPTSNAEFNVPYCQKTEKTKDGYKLATEGFGTACAKDGYKLIGYLPPRLVNGYYQRYKDELNKRHYVQYTVPTQREELISPEVEKKFRGLAYPAAAGGLIGVGAMAVGFKLGMDALALAGLGMMGLSLFVLLVGGALIIEYYSKKDGEDQVER